MIRSAAAGDDPGARDADLGELAALLTEENERPC
jgi:hypothetical protein